MTEDNAKRVHRFIDTLEHIHGNANGMFLHNGQFVGEFPDGYVLVTIPLAPTHRLDPVEQAIRAWFSATFPNGKLVAISFLGRDAGVGIYFTLDNIVLNKTLQAVRQRVQDTDSHKTVFYPIKSISAGV